jgi:integrase
MSVDLRRAASDYLDERRARGYQLTDYDCLISKFFDGLETRGVTTITLVDALAFAQEPANISPHWRAQRLAVIRNVAAYVRSLDPTGAELIPPKLIRSQAIRRIPYLYSSEQIAQLMKLTATLRPLHVAATMRTLIGLLAATGLRSGEAVALNVSDLRVDEGVLHVMGKYAKPRIIPLHSTTVDALCAYLVIRATVSPSTDALLIAPRGGRLDADAARAAFRILVDVACLTARPGGATPRLHDFRHVFAVNSLIDAHRRGGDVDATIAALVSYLGHVNPKSTYWYLSASPELMTVVSERIAAYHGRLS